MSRVIVVGDGIVGLTSALALLREGVSVDLIGDPGAQPAASWGNAGHIALEQVEPLACYSNLFSLPRRLFSFGGPASFPVEAAGDWLPFGLRMLGASSARRFDAGRRALRSLAQNALPAWRALASDLGRPELLIEQGHHVVWEGRSQLDRGMASWASRDIGSARFRELEEAELAAVSGVTTAPLAGGIHFENTASISSHAAFREALLARFRSLGGRLFEWRVERLCDLDADQIAVCAGVGSARLLEEHSRVKAPLIAERGYHIEGDAPSWPFGMPPVVFEDRSIIATRFVDRLRIAGFVEFSSADRQPDERKFRALKRHCEELGIELDNVRRWMGSRPTLPDYVPAIGRLADDSRVFYAFGHQHLGLTLGPATATALADLMRGREPAIDLRPFDLARFG